MPETVVNASSLEWLAGYEPHVSEDFRDWFDLQRLAFNTVATRILIQALEAARRKADWKTVEFISSTVLALDAYNESAVLAQAEAAAMRGGKRKAVSILDRFLADIGDDRPDLQIPTRILRRRIVDRIPDRPTRLSEQLPFVGRNAEMQILAGSLKRAREVNGGCV